MSLVKKNRIDHQPKNSKNLKKETKRLKDQQRKISEALNGFAKKAK